MRARIIRAYIAKPKNIPLISLISQQTVQRDKRDKRVIFPLDSHIYARGSGSKCDYLTNTLVVINGVERSNNVTCIFSHLFVL